MSNFTTGTILETGPIMARRIWIIDRETATQIVVTELQWSKDLVNELNCARRTTHQERLKKRTTTTGRQYLYKKGVVGYFE